MVRIGDFDMNRAHLARRCHYDIVSYGGKRAHRVPAAKGRAAVQLTLQKPDQGVIPGR
jgi:hypothetical protein